MNMNLNTPDVATIVDRKIDRETVFNQLMVDRGGYENDFYLGRILSSWLQGEGVLPAYVGIDKNEYFTLVKRHFADNPLLLDVHLDSGIDEERIPEWEDLFNLMVEYRAGTDESEVVMAKIIATACMGLDHLWQDLGFWSRQELSEVLQLNFPALAERNVKNMKWKKFLYKQLCERDDTFVCRAPSCDVCADYDKCFGPEE